MISRQAFRLGAAVLAAFASPMAAAGDATPPKDAASPSPQQFELLLRHYIEDKRVDGEPVRRPWVQAMQANYAASWQGGGLGIGLEASLFAAYTLHDSAAVGEVAHQRRGALEKTTAYPGRYALRLELGKASIKYGLQSVANPVVDGKDNLWLPPTFRGVLFGYAASEDLTFDAGSLDAMNARSHDGLQNLVSAYGGVPIARLDYAGAVWKYRPDAQAALYASRARDVWEQLYGSLSHGIRAGSGRLWTGAAAAYHARNLAPGLTGEAPRGRAYSLSLSSLQGGVETSIVYQRMLGPGFMEYVLESYGLALPNVLVSDYNAPDEKSLQLKWRFDETALGLPDTQLSFWFISGRSTELALPHGPALRNGRRHGEIGLAASHQLRSGPLRKGVLALIAVAHRASSDFPDPPQHAWRLTFEIPFKVF